MLLQALVTEIFSVRDSWKSNNYKKIKETKNCTKNEVKKIKSDTESNREMSILESQNWKINNWIAP